MIRSQFRESVEKQNKRMIFLDLLRIFAFISVLIGHNLYNYLPHLLQPFFKGGGSGVMVFFLVSGYIITKVLMDENPKEFLIKRFFRIYPLYFFAVLLYHALAYLVEHKPILPFEIVAQISLMGDFFSTPYALNGVEWTLRIEMMFYLLMSLLKSFGFFRKIQFLPFIFIAVTLALQYFGPFTIQHEWSAGFITLFMPFLFCGSAIFLMEKKLVSNLTVILCITYIYISCFMLAHRINSNPDLELNFVTLGSLIFTGAWLLREKFKPSYIIILLSDLTYSVYLFHNWLWEYLEKFIIHIGFPNRYIHIEILALLLIICYVTHVSIENRGNALGKRLSGVRTAS